MAVEKPEIYISYSWKEDSEKVAQELEQQLKNCGLELIRDKINGVGYMQSISDFMNKIGKGKYVLLVLGNDYLKSKNCMYELSKISEYSRYNFTEIQERVFIITLKNIIIYNDRDRAKLINHWQDEKAELEIIVNQSKNPRDHKPTFEDIDLYDEILKTLREGVVSKIADLNTLIPEKHKEEGYQQVIYRLVNTINRDTNGEIDLSSVNFISLLNQIETNTTLDKSKNSNMFDLKAFKKDLEELVDNTDIRNVFKNIDECDFIDYNKHNLNILRQEFIQDVKKYDFPQRLSAFIDGIKLKK